MKKFKVYSFLFILFGLASVCFGLGINNVNEYADASYMNGGVLYFSQNTTGTISGTISGGVSNEAGGGVYVGNGATVTLSSTGVIKDCQASGGAPGGGVYIDRGTFNVSGTIENCEDDGYGGAAIFMEGASSRLNLYGGKLSYDNAISTTSYIRAEGGIVSLHDGFIFDTPAGNTLFYINGAELWVSTYNAGFGNVSDNIYIKALSSTDGQGTMKFSDGGGFNGSISSDYLNPFVVGIYSKPAANVQFNFVDVPAGLNGYAIAYLDDASYFDANQWNVEGYQVVLGTYQGSNAVLLSAGVNLNFDLGMEYSSHNFADPYFSGWNVNGKVVGGLTITILSESQIKLNGTLTGDVVLSLSDIFMPYEMIYKASINYVSGTISGYSSSYCSFKTVSYGENLSQLKSVTMTGTPTTSISGMIGSDMSIVRYVKIMIDCLSSSKVTFTDAVFDLNLTLFSDNHIAASTYTTSLSGVSGTLPNITTPASIYSTDKYLYPIFTFDGYYSGKNGTGTKYYNADGTPATTANFSQNTTLYGYWTDIPIAEIKVYQNDVSFYAGYDVENALGTSVCLTKFYTHKGNSGLNSITQNPNTFEVRFSAGADPSLGCPADRTWTGTMTFEDDFNTYTLNDMLVEGENYGFFSEDQTYELSRVASNKVFNLYFKNAPNGTGTVNTTSYTASYGDYVQMTSLGRLGIYNQSGTLKATIIGTPASGFTFLCYQVYLGSTTSGSVYTTLEDVGDRISITGASDNYTFEYLGQPATSYRVSVNSTAAGISVDGATYSSSSPYYFKTSGSVIVFSTVLQAASSNSITDGTKFYRQCPSWTIFVDGEQVYHKYNSSTSTLASTYSLTVTGNMTVEITKQIDSIATSALPITEDESYTDNLEIIQPFIDDKRYYVNKKYLNRITLQNEYATDLFIQEKFNIGAIEVQL